MTPFTKPATGGTDPLRWRCSAHISQIHERAYRGRSLTQAQEISNTAKSRAPR